MLNSFLFVFLFFREREQEFYVACLWFFFGQPLASFFLSFILHRIKFGFVILMPWTKYFSQCAQIGKCFPINLWLYSICTFLWMIHFIFRMTFARIYVFHVPCDIFISKTFYKRARLCAFLLAASDDLLLFGVLCEWLCTRLKQILWAINDIRHIL